ncbi:MAG: hypothetical protein ACRDRK_18030 [Pseudonocardia sp.]
MIEASVAPREALTGWLIDSPARLRSAIAPVVEAARSAARQAVP